jgi:hypothetical protein
MPVQDTTVRTRIFVSKPNAETYVDGFALIYLIGGKGGEREGNKRVGSVRCKDEDRERGIEGREGKRNGGKRVQGEKSAHTVTCSQGRPSSPNITYYVRADLLTSGSSRPRNGGRRLF